MVLTVRYLIGKSMMVRLSDQLRVQRRNLVLWTLQLRVSILFLVVRTVSSEYGTMIKEFATIPEKDIQDILIS